MPKSKYEYFLEHIGQLLTEYSFDAIKDHQKSTIADKEFKSGYLMGLHRAVTLIQKDAEAFDIDIKEVGLDSIAEQDFFIN